MTIDVAQPKRVPGTSQQRRVEYSARSPPGGKKTAVAVAHMLLMMSYHRLLTRIFYEEERSDSLSPQQKERQRQWALRDGVGQTDWVTVAMIQSAPHQHKRHVAIENLPTWHLPCSWCRDQVAYAVYGRVFHRGTRFLVDASVDEG